MTHQKILSMLNGYSSQKPMPFDVLVQKSGLLPDTLRMVLDQMQHTVPATINSAIITKGGVAKTVCWPTGVVTHSISKEFVINANKSAEAGFRLRQSSTPKQKMNPIAPTTQEPIMNQETKPRGGSKPSELNQCIYDKIVEHPGIAHADLVKHAQKECPEATDKQILKTISNMRHVTKKIRAEGERGNYRYHLNRDVVTPPPSRTKKTAIGKVVTGAEANALRKKTQPKPVRAKRVKKPAPTPAPQTALAKIGGFFRNLFGQK